MKRESTNQTPLSDQLPFAYAADQNSFDIGYQAMLMIIEQAGEMITEQEVMKKRPAFVSNSTMSLLVDAQIISYIDYDKREDDHMICEVDDCQEPHGISRDDRMPGSYQIQSQEAVLQETDSFQSSVKRKSM